MRLNAIDDFTVVSLVAWPLNESEAGGDVLPLIETSLLFYFNDAVCILIRRNLHNKRSKVSIITRPPPASLSFKGQVTRHTTVKRFNNEEMLAVLCIWVHDRAVCLAVRGLIHMCTGSHRSCSLSVAAIWNHVGKSVVEPLFFV